MAHLTNSLVTPEQLHQRARFSSLPTDLQDTIFYTTQCLTQAAGLLLQLPQSTTAQANVLLARYWLVDSEMQHEFSDVSAACIYIVAKCGPFPRSPRDVSNVYAYLLSPVSPLAQPPNTTNPDDAPDPTKYYQSEADYFAAHNRILALEGRILYALSFDTRVALPHPLAVTYLQALDFLAQPREVVSERAVAYLNAALLSPQLLYLTHQPSALAVAAVYNAARDLGAKMPECEWWEVFDVEREELGFLVVGLRSLEGWVRQQKEALASGDKALVPALLGGEGVHRLQTQWWTTRPR
uniref:Cyclin domain-containing protein n=1 Tax=Pyricularia oryzae (strain P131) TaxID=1143193 RepID=L7J533_PYRO1